MQLRPRLKIRNFVLCRVFLHLMLRDGNKQLQNVVGR
jgi:hypothetical protein